MKIKYIRGLWGMEQPSLKANLETIKAGGFDGVEMGAPAERSQRLELRSLLADLGLGLIVQQWTGGNSPQEHAASFEEQYNRAVEMEPLFVNSQTGKDFYTTAQNLVVFQRAAELEQSRGVRVMHEIHRGRATFCTMASMALLDAMPALKFTADLSHWCCVHESLLHDQVAWVDRVIKHCHHIHARVGFAEGPQVNDPRAPEWREAVETHIGWWQKIIACRRQEGCPALTICLEFGPPDYMPTQPFTRQPVANLWEINCYMKDLLKERFKAGD